MAQYLDISRNVILINDKIPYKRHLDLENQLIETIWIEIMLPTNKNLLIMGGYRQWRLLKEVGIDGSNRFSN